MIVIETGLIAPPVGLNVFVNRSVARDVPFRRSSRVSCHFTWR
ncbi:hypothetical protein [Roseibium sp.]